MIFAIHPHLSMKRMPTNRKKRFQQPVARRRSKETFMGMTAQQRFILSLMMFFMVCLLGSVALVITGSIAIPGL